VPAYHHPHARFQRERPSGLSKIGSSFRIHRSAGARPEGRPRALAPLPKQVRRFSGKEVIQPQVPLRLPCYDFTPIIKQTVGACPLAVGSTTSGPSNFRGVTGGVYKARERIHRGMLIRDY